MGGNGAAAGDAGQQGQQQGGEQQQGGPDIGAFAQQLEALGPQLEQQRQSLQAVTDWIGQQQQAEQGQEGEGEPLLDLSQIDPEFAYRPEDQQQQIQQGIQSALQDMVQRELGPLQEQMQQDRIEREATVRPPVLPAAACRADQGSARLVAGHLLDGARRRGREPRRRGRVRAGSNPGGRRRCGTGRRQPAAGSLLPVPQRSGERSAAVLKRRVGPVCSVTADG
jgi:hypothetical protein